ncbi:predicted protein [Streptomyces viridosporus ATCC 14672]|uniref:Predicted protein n=1 Tax=Streptomyces viridosporus (strain ATCC 14672 / DSM 40746 / JCM 4963 / KCTC 9882 / NRRL B-12104 / FH 1290) TaxID=566461 RepID=D6A1E6_STRV1|nr:predicted protein [Streptomyces viridosporus ATCC 14672]
MSTFPTTRQAPGRALGVALASLGPPVTHEWAEGLRAGQRQERQGSPPEDRRPQAAGAAEDLTITT